MRCSEVEAVLRDFLHGELDPGTMRGVQLHLGGCAACRERAGRLRAGNDVVAPYHLVALIHGELSADEQRLVEAHLSYCMFCREEHERLRAAAHEIIKNLSQYQLSRLFRQRVMQEWRPHRIGRHAHYRQRGLADMIERAEAGNTFSYERHVDRFKDYAYLAAYLRVKDFHWAAEIAAAIFAGGMPAFRSELTQQDFLAWLREKAERVAEKGSWLGRDDSIGDTAEGLSGYEGSRKLRRHRIVLDLVSGLEEAHRLPFLLCCVQRLNYAEIGSILELGREEVTHALCLSTRQAMLALREDDKNHPRALRLWER